MKSKTLLILLFSWCSSVLASDSLQVGKPCPDVKLTDVHYYNKKAISVSDFKGKWLVLDFFSRGCLSCFESFPKMSALRKEFKDKMEIVLVGADDEKIRPIYERFRKKQNLDLPVAYDTVLFKEFKIRAVPYIIIIDPEGIVKAITPSLSHQGIVDLLKGKDTRMQNVQNADEIKRRSALYDPNKPLLINNNGGDDTTFLFRSILTQWDGVIGGGNNRHIDQYMKNKVQVVGLPIVLLYQIAYGDTVGYVSYGQSYGKWWEYPVLESKDPALEFNWGFPENKYNYSLIAAPHKASTQYLKEAMQRDLMNYFGYNVTIEDRMMPCWKIVASKIAKTALKTKGGKSFTKNLLESKGIEISNQPIARLIDQLWLFNGNEPPFIDETGIEGNIDLMLDIIITDFEDWKRALKKAGLSLIKSEKEMKVIVIRDPVDRVSK